MPNFINYLPPGVYVEEALSPVISIIGISPTIVGIAGPSVGYRTHTETITLTGTDAIELEQLGIDTTTGFQITDNTGSPYSSAGYTLTVLGGEDINLVTTRDNVTTIARVDSGTGTPIVPDSSVVFVSYRFTDPDYHLPFRSFDYDDVRAAFGEALNPVTGAIASPLSLAAKIAFENGATEVVLVATTGTSEETTRTQLTEAYTKLEIEQDVNIIVPLPVGILGTETGVGDVINIGTDLRGQLEKSLNNGQLRVGILGYDVGVSVPPDDIVGSLRSERLVLAFPNSLDYFVGLQNRIVTIGGFYLAAAYAGRLSSLPVQMPLTKKQITGFSGISSPVLSTMNNSYKNKLSDAGVAVTEVARDRRLVVRHGTTTDRSSVNTRELSVVRARDSLINLLRDTIDRAGLIGTPIDLNTPTRVKGVVAGVLESAVNAQVIVDYASLKARQLTLDPTVIEVKFEYKPAYPLNYIVVAFAIATSTGDVALLNQAIV
jgi:hypothetical protein